MLDEYESIPKDLVENREVTLNALKAMKIESEPLREILTNIFLGEPLMSGLPECPDVSKEFVMAWVCFSASKQKFELKQFTETLKDFVTLFKNEEEAQLFEDFIDALFSKPFVKLMIDELDINKHSP